MVFRQGSCEGQDMAPLPPKDQRHPWLRYQVEGYTEDIVHNYEQRLETIFGRSVNRDLFTSHMWRRVFEIQGPLVQEFLIYFILALGLHTAVEMAEDGFEAYWLGSERVIPDKGAPEKVTGIDLFYLRSMDRGTANVPYLLAQYLFRYAEGRKIRARLNIYERLGDMWAWVAPGPERQPNVAAGAPKAVGDAPAVDDGASTDPESI
ncbi:hypothetical protein Tco_0963652 [Tanacetum coccineum]